MDNVLDAIQETTRRIAEGRDPKVQPGQPFRFTEAATVGDGVWQGDVGISIIGFCPPVVKKPKFKAPKGYVRVENVGTALKVQLGSENTQGSSHLLDSASGVEMYHPANWDDDMTDGPIMLLTEERTITHPVHGDVTIPAGNIVKIHYQREYDRELEKERRSRD